MKEIFLSCPGVLTSILKENFFLYMFFYSLAILSGLTSQEKAMGGAMKNADANGTWWMQST